MKITIPEIIARKNKQKLSVLTAYTFQIAQIMDGEVDMILVGDSLWMVMYGMDSTVGVSLEMMIAHGNAVTKAAKKSFVVVDMPYGTYEKSPEQAYQNASRIIAETACDAVKLEGGVAMAATIKFLVDNKIPVMAHIGLLPQSVNLYGGYKIQGKDEASENQLIEDAKAVEAAGAFAAVIEGVKKAAADKITKAVNIPTIGIGASVECDGQVLVIDDMLGLTIKPPKFVKQYANLKEDIRSAVKAYVADVKDKKFPSEENCY
jgi:3-methyl-2-oxobutanoate hydroxymethyltransferase